VASILSSLIAFILKKIIDRVI